MDASRTQRIVELNDLCRTAMGIGGKLIITPGISDLDEQDRSNILEGVMNFNDFTEKNDPYGEHDFGSFTYQRIVIFWKIDYYDKELLYDSQDPSDPKKTKRVLTVMLSEEY